MDRRQWWIFGSIALLTLAACGSTPAPTFSASTTPRSTSTGSSTPTTGVTATRSAWTQIATSSAPLARNSAGFAYDAATGTDLLTGGRTGCAPGSGQYLDTWSWSGSAWTQLHPTLDGPGQMAWFTMAYDPATRQDIAVGAYSGCGISTGMWTWNGSQWAQAPDSLAEPDALASYSLAYDSSSHLLMLFGDSLSSVDGEPLLPGHEGSETWSWDGTRWTFLHPAASPPEIRDSAMTYDDATHQIVLFGGDTRNPSTNMYTGSVGGTWLWNGTTWAQANPAESPSPRFGASLAYDPDLGAAVLFGGVAGDVIAQPPTVAPTVFDDMWSWSGTTWTQLHPSTLPSGRFFSQMTYDATNHELVLFGGSLNQVADANDLWVFRTS